MKRTFVLLAAVAGLGLANAAKASTVASVYEDGTAQTGDLGSQGSGQYIDYINGRSPNQTYTSNVINGSNYSGGDLTPINTFTNGESTLTDELHTTIFKFNGYITVPAGDSVTFTTTTDDGAQFYVDNTAVAGSGTLVTNDDGSHGPSTGTNTIILSGTHSIQLLYFNQDYANGNGGAVLHATITDANGAIAISATPEPASIGLLGLGAMGLVARRRRA